MAAGLGGAVDIGAAVDLMVDIPLGL
jgi:hypothetical protein